MKKMLALFACFFLSGHLFSAKAADSLWLRIYGHVNAEIYYDSRQMICGREGNVALYPAPVIPDPDGHDINARASFGFSLLSSRIGVQTKNIDFLSAQSHAVLEADFLGTSAQTFSTLRLRHAYVNMQWTATNLLFGQYWHPLFVPECFPGVVSFGGGVPYHPLNRGPQLRLSHQLRHLRLSAMLISQNDFSSPGPQGYSSRYIRQSGRPEVFFQGLFQQGRLLAGASAGWLSLLPELTTYGGYRNTELMESFSGNAFVRIKLGSFSLKLQGIYGENLAHLVMMGGYGEELPPGINPLPDPSAIRYRYTGIRSYSLWADAAFTRDNFYAGIFWGFAENLGSKKPVYADHWGRATNIDRSYRISPRAGYIRGKASLNLELIYDRAVYGVPDQYFNINLRSPADNWRMLASIKYAF